MTDRERQVVELLCLLDEWVPGPRLSRVYAAARPGTAGSSDSYLADQQTAFAARYGDDRRVASLRRDGEIRRLELARKHEAGLVDDRELEAWEAAKLRLDRESSLPELRVVLADLAASDFFSLMCLRVVYGYDNELRWAVGPLVRAAADGALVWVADRMPTCEAGCDRHFGKPCPAIRLPPGPPEMERKISLWRGHGIRAERARAARDEEIRERRAEGVSVRDLAARYCLDEKSVKRICSTGGERVA